MVGYGKCPTVETADVEVRFLDSDSSVVKSCATFKFKSRDETPGVKSFSLKFNRSNNDVLRPCASGTCNKLCPFIFFDILVTV